MNPAELAALHTRVNAALAGTQRQREAGSWSPVARYLDGAQFADEQRRLRRWPIALLPAAQLPRPGDWQAASAHGVPLLLVRDGDGTLRAFINVCRHRGAALADAGACGSGRERFVCPYHSWSYDRAGRCIGRPHEADFAHAPRAQSGLVPLPCTERLGLVWVVAQPAADRRSADFDWDAYFGPMGAELAALGYGTEVQAPHQRRFEQPSNWKLVLDANLESYHFAYAHRETIAPLFHDNLVLHDRFGEHHRILLPKPGFAELPGPPDTLAGYGRVLNIIYFFFPCTALLWEGDHVNGFSLQPTRVDACDVNGWLLAPPEQAARRDAEHWQRNFALFWQAIDEDFALAASMQRGLASGANEALCFGANEFACGQFHESLARL